ncbi:MAG: type II secretion system protein [Cyanobacteriota bacterium]|nr:type II secretion system protein [Cyanobacteriota bacterium]MDY6358874.1 type II secretion system protein [Cyanobacteriota bacterium]MDY6363645.1 type II secretion system protein [Cyanobacteriota bacterium]MDY6382597.1 type II secretion system protein [Cyanobacteriota bacterium]
MKIKKKGFTLAEVLITLGIIGVVVAMTIPTLIQNANSAKFSAQFKKSISTLSQAALMGEAQYDVDFGTLTNECSANYPERAAQENLSGVDGNTNIEKDAEDRLHRLTFCALFNSTLSGKTFLGWGDKITDPKSGGKYKWQYSKTLTESYGLNKMYVYSLADGSLFGFKPEAKRCGIDPGEIVDKAMLTSDGKLRKQKCIGFIDVNGTATPNIEVTCENKKETALDPTNPCKVPTGSKLGDIYPIVFHDGVVEPASNAAKAVFTRGK